MRDRERLDLLRSIAGTTHFEEKKHKSLRLLNEEKDILEKIEVNLNQLQKRVKKLEKEKEEVRKWRAKRDEKEAIQWCIYEKAKEKSLSYVKSD